MSAWLRFDLIEAFTASFSAKYQVAIRQFNVSTELSDPLAAYNVALSGRTAKIGWDILVGHVAAQFIRCHRIADRGGSAGPDL